MNQKRSIAGAQRSQYPLDALETAAMVNAEMDLRNRIILELFTCCGLRVAEVAQLTVARLDLARESIEVVGKGNKVRRIPIPPYLAAHLQEWIPTRRRYMGGAIGYSDPLWAKTRAYVFPGRRGGAITARTLQDIVKAAAVRAGVKPRAPGLVHVNPHTLRHTYARRLKDLGLRLEDVAMLLGHSNILKTAAMYGTRSYEEVSAEVRKKLF